jgi:hypothetical protein
VLRALEREPDRRYPDAKTMADELEAVLQEARFAPRAMTRMLDELFGEHNPQVELLVPEGSLVNQIAASASPPANAVKLASGDAVLPNGQLPVLEDDEESYTGVSSVRRLPTKPRRRISWMAAAAGVALTVAGGAALLGSRRSKVNADDIAIATIPPEPLADPAPAPASPPVAAPATDPAPAPAPTAVEETPEPVRTENVSVKIASDPPGAEVTAEDGIRLGVTPTTLSIRRSDKPLVLVIGKGGFQTTRQTIVPDRDVAALLTLRADDDGAARKRPATARPRRNKPAAPATGDGRVREGLSIDPFAEDPKSR